eukprot:1144499-Pelagomonas_calceolata.AAC.2
MKSHEGKEDGSEEGGGEGGMASKMSEVQRTIERGGLWQQITAITLLRLTPVVSGHGMRVCASARAHMRTRKKYLWWVGTSVAAVTPSA